MTNFDREGWRQLSSRVGNTYVINQYTHTRMCIVNSPIRL